MTSTHHNHPHKLAENVLGLFESVVMAVAGSAPAYSIAASTALLVAAVGLAGPASLLYCGIAKSGFAASPERSRWWEYSIEGVAPKLLSNDVCAAIGLAQLSRLDDNQARRRQLWNRYQRELAAFDWMELPVDAAEGDRHSYFTYCVRLGGTGDRDRLARHLYDRGIYTTLRYHPLHLIPIYQSTAVLPISEQLNETALSLPLHPKLSDAEFDQILAGIASFRQS